MFNFAMKVYCNDDECCDKIFKKTFMVFASILLFLFEMEKIKYIKYDNCTYMKEEKK